MAQKNHALDDKITNAALREFLESGYEKASMRKIAAAAGVTIGAIYTRYPTKDQLFLSLVLPLMERIDQAFCSLKGAYGSPETVEPSQLAQSMQTESQAILHLLFDDYDRAVLLLCRSQGSSLESFFDGVLERKIQETIAYFRSAQLPHPDAGVLRLLVSGQFHMYFQILSEGCDLEEAKHRMYAAMIYHTGGWLTLLRMQESEQTEV